LVDRRVTCDIRRIVRQGTQCESILVDVLAFEQQPANKVSAADVMHQVAEFSVAEWVVTEILDNSASIRVGMGLPDLVFLQSRIPLEQQGLDRISPEQVYNLLVSQNRVCGRAIAAHQHNEKNCHCTRKQAPTLRNGA